MKRDRVKNILDNVAGRKVAVVGDLMLDVYVWGKVSRISPEAPVPVVHVKEKTFSLGGAANVMRNIVSLGGEALAFGIIGAGTNGRRLLKLMKEENINTDNIIVDNDYITIEKQRIIADSQQLARVDYEDKDTVLDEQQNSITNTLLAGIESGSIEGVIFEDYAKGLLDTTMINSVISAAKKRNVPVALDPHPSHKMEVKGLTLMTPNHLEAFGLAGIYLKDFSEPLDKDSILKNVAFKINEEWEIKYLLITLGAKGMLLFEEGKDPVHIPTMAREVFDVTGAGDTVIAVNTLSLLGGASAVEAAQISNHAAGIVVGRIGTSSVTKREIFDKF
jgi:D-glycero-beta-D-manno-heptose-7-phosphate kinase